MRNNWKHFLIIKGSMKQKGITKYVCIKQYSFERNKTVENKKTKDIDKFTVYRL